MVTTTPTAAGQKNFRLGLVFAIGSAFTFGMSGPIAKSLMEAGWSPNAAVTARLAGGAVVLAIVASFLKPDWVHEARAHARTVIIYGLFPVAGAQLCYYNAVAHLPVGVALLLEYTAPILVVGWIWATTRQAPSRLTLAGVALAVVGVTLVLDVFSPGDTTHFDRVGVIWGLCAAVCAASYFMMSDEVTADGSGLNAITLAAGGLVVAAIAVGALGLTGLMPLTFTANDTSLAGMTVPWVIPVVLLGVVPTAVAYTLGISGVARLRPSFASLVGLSEVLFAVLAACLLLGEQIGAAQAVGGIVVLLGLTLARQGDRSPAVDAATWPDQPLRDPSLC